MKRSELKGLIKECMIELLMEGLDSSEHRSVIPVAEKKSIRESVGGGPRDRQRPSIHHPNSKPQPKGSVEREFLSSVKRSSPQVDSSLLTSNPILKDVLKDTAAKTLPQFIEANVKHEKMGEMGGVIGDAYALTAAQHEPEELFGDEAVKNWGTLAFPEG